MECLDVRLYFGCFISFILVMVEFSKSLIVVFFVLFLKYNLFSHHKREKKK